MSATGSGRGGVGSVSLEDLIALNDEIIALTRSGMPLERGLMDLGRDLPGRLRRLATRVGDAMGAGASLPQALEGLGPSVPPVYRAVVRAGLRSGELPRALEGVASVARGVTDARRAISLALWYPLIVLGLAYGLFLFLMAAVLPKFEAVMLDLSLPLPAGFRYLLRFGAWRTYWGPLLPLLVGLLLIGWVSTGSALNLLGGGRLGLLRRLPAMGPMIRDFEAASFAELLALLVGHGVPYPEALRLAGEASGDRALRTSAEAIAARVERGLPPAEGAEGAVPLPPLLGWVVSVGPASGDFVAALREMAARYRREGAYRAQKIRVLAPSVLLCGIGVVATLLYALAVFVPISTLWNGLAAPLR